MKNRKIIISEFITILLIYFITHIMVDLIVYEQQESKYLIVVNLWIIVHCTLYKKGQCIKINNVENTPFNIKNYVTNDILIVNHIELKVYSFLMKDIFLTKKI